jgi:hypothetical protein
VRWWKVAGLAGLAGVAASGVAVARAERRRQAYTPDEVRERLHARMDELPPDPVPEPPEAQQAVRGPSNAAAVRLRSLRARAMPARPSRLLRRARARFR